MNETVGKIKRINRLLETRATVDPAWDSIVVEVDAFADTLQLDEDLSNEERWKIRMFLISFIVEHKIFHDRTSQFFTYEWDDTSVQFIHDTLHRIVLKYD
tara:strand:+ start:443 stop:742 length:300 start_codon:yes stop_codon:yes gene_type:complete